MKTPFIRFLTNSKGLLKLRMYFCNREDYTSHAGSLSPQPHKPSVSGYKMIWLLISSTYLHLEDICPPHNHLHQVLQHMFLVQPVATSKITHTGSEQQISQQIRSATYQNTLQIPASYLWFSVQGEYGSGVMVYLYMRGQLKLGQARLCYVDD